MSYGTTNVEIQSLEGRRILFANFPADGHFNPLTGLAVYLKEKGCDVRWYTSKNYSTKVAKLGIQHYPFVKGMEIINENFDLTFPERTTIKGQVRKLKFDMINAFILRGPEYYADLMEIHESFPFELVVADCAFSAIPFITDKMNTPVISVGVMPLTETSVDLPPAGLGLTPSKSMAGRIWQSILRAATRRFIFGEPNRVMWKLLDDFGIRHHQESIFDMLIRKSTMVLQSGTPGFEYSRTDLSKHIRFIGPLLPHSSAAMRTPWHDERLNKYEKIIVVTQGTVEKDIEKLLVPSLEAFRDTEFLVVATTGGSGTEVLRSRFPQENIIIEDFIPFGDVMPYADVYITNGGYGGVMLGIEHELPMVVAGVHEGKNEINARIGYFGMGINLKMEKPKPQAIRKATEKIFSEPAYKERIVNLAKEFKSYDPQRLTAQYIGEVLDKTRVEKETMAQLG